MYVLNSLRDLQRPAYYIVNQRELIVVAKVPETLAEWIFESFENDHSIMFAKVLRDIRKWTQALMNSALDVELLFFALSWKVLLNNMRF